MRTLRAVGSSNRPFSPDAKAWARLVRTAVLTGGSGCLLLACYRHGVACYPFATRRSRRAHDQSKRWPGQSRLEGA